MELYEVRCQAGLGLLWVLVEASSPKEAIKVARPMLKEMARGRKMFNLRAERY